jgi:outer membrane receptor protein involved in Fe transport
LKKGGRFEAGIKSSHVKTDNDAIYDSIQNGNVIRDINRSNHFIYEETIHAAYLNLNQSLSKKIGVQLGLRMEHTNAGGKQLTTGVDFKRRYLQIFPTAYFQYKADEKNTLVLNYGRRIRRPGYQSLNPFIKFIDRYTYSSGNPNLKPELSDQFEVSHNWRNMISTTVNYTYTDDIYDNVIEQKGNEAYKIPANIASHRQFGFAINANTRLNKWWTSSIALNVFNNRYKGQVSNTPISQEATSFIISGIQQFKLSKTLTVELNGRYRNGWYEGVIKASPVGFVGAGISKQMMKDKATLRLAVKDIFFSQQFRGESRYGNVDFTFLDSKDTRQVTVGFTYRFSKGKKISPSKKTTGSAVEEQERIEQ